MLQHFGVPGIQAVKENIRILNRVRFVAIVAQLTLVIFASWYLQIRLPLVWLIGLISLEIIFQIYSVWRVSQTKIILSRIEVIIPLIFDSIVLAALVYFSGGANNPFIYLLLLFIMLGTLMLSSTQLMLVAVLQLGLYSLLNIFQRPLELGSSSPLASFHLHLMGMWVNFVLTVILMVVFGLITRHVMLNKEKKIQALREDQLKDEQILSLGIMAASAAHELGTPLSTMAIIVDDLAHEKLSSEMQSDMQLLLSQINTCRHILKSLNEKNTRARHQLVHMQSNPSQGDQHFKSELQRVFQHWLVYRPQIQLTQQWSDDFAELKGYLALSVEQAVINLLDNAADASLANSSDQVALHCYCEQHQCVIEISDNGSGITPEIKQTLGVNIQPTQKVDGLGWGLFLSNASIERAGGSVQLIAHSSGGTLTRVALPLESLQ